MAHYFDPIVKRSRDFVCCLNNDFCITNTYAAMCCQPTFFKYGVETCIELNESIDTNISRALVFHPTDSSGIFRFKDHMETPVNERTIAENILMYSFFDFAVKHFFPMHLKTYTKKVVARRIGGVQSCLLVNPQATAIFDLLEWVHYYVSYNTKTTSEREFDMLAKCLKDVGVTLPADMAIDIAEHIQDANEEEKDTICPMCSSDMSFEKISLYYYINQIYNPIAKECSNPHCHYVRCPPMHYSGDWRLLKMKALDTREHAFILNENLFGNIRRINCFDSDDEDTDDEIIEAWEEGQQELWHIHNENNNE